MARRLVSDTLVLLLSGLACGQPVVSPAFDAASVRVSKPGTTDGGGLLSAGRAQFQGVTLLDLITVAYGVDDEMVFGGPSWLGADRFDVIARSAPSSPDETLRAMLQTLLAERFKLELHREDKTVPVYALALGKRAPKLKEAAVQGPAECSGGGRQAGLIVYTCRNMTMGNLAEQLRGMAGAYFDHRVVDMTGLSGAYDFALSWTPRGQLRKTGDADPASNISIFDAVDKQLGLKLEAQKQSMSVVVIDSVNREPAGNPAGVTRALPPPPKEFEVASVRPSAPGTNSRGARLLPSGQLELPGTTLKDLITMAYDIDDEVLVEAPKWLDVDRFDVNAKTAAGVPFDAVQVMLQALLADRFKLAVHKDEQALPVYALTVGKRGLKLKESSGSARSGCKMSAGDGVRIITCENTTMADLAGKLREVARAYFDHAVVDLTGLKGAYDFSLSWAPKARIAGMGGRGGDSSPSPGGASVAEPTGDLTIFEAVDKQLGLKLTLQKHPMPVMVIDRVERTPTEN